MVERVNEWKRIAEKVLACRACNFISSGVVVHPDPGWGNLYAPIFVVGINSNWGVRRDEMPTTLDRLRQVLQNPRFQQYKVVDQYWDWANNRADSSRFFDATRLCSNFDELQSSMKRWQAGLSSDYPQYDSRLFSDLSGVFRHHGVEVDGLTTLQKRVTLWRWVYWSNAVRCPSSSADEIQYEEYRNCFWDAGASGNVLQKELSLVDPSLIVVLGRTTLESAKLGETIESRLGKLLGASDSKVQEIEVSEARSTGAPSFCICEYRRPVTPAGGRSRLRVLLLPHPNRYRFMNRCLRSAVHKRVHDEVLDSWRKCEGTAPTRLCCINVPA